MSMTTLEQVLAAYGPLVPLDKICEAQFAVAYRSLSREKIRQTMPFPVFRTRESRKAPWVCKASDYADWIDRQASASREPPKE